MANIFKTKFEYEGKTYQFERELNQLDRNFDDEGYALMLEKNPTSTNGGYFEINLLKTNEIAGHFNGKSYVAVYDVFDDTMPSELLDCELEIKIG